MSEFWDGEAAPPPATPAPRMRHAPRGRIKARDPMPVSDQMPCRCGKPHLTKTGEPSCVGHSKRHGGACVQPRIPGAAVCYWHGGAAPQVKAAAAKRLEELRPLAIRRLEWLMEQEEYPTTMLGASRDVLDRVDGRPTEHVDLHVTSEVGARLEQARQVAAQRNRQPK
jgi:hypothetical protein